MKKRFVKILAYAMALSMMTSVFTGCAKNGTETAESTDKESTDEAAADSSAGGEAEEDYGPIISELDLSQYVTLGDYKNLSVSKNDTEPTEAEIDERVDEALASMATEDEVTGRPVQEGDIANIDYEGKKDGVAFDGGTAQGFDLEIGSGTFIPGFEDGLIGMEIGETKDLNLTFPENYGNAELAGADVVFTCTVNSIKEKSTPALTDELAAELDEDVRTVKEYRDKIADDLRQENEQTAEQDAKTDLINEVVENSEFREIPEGLVNEQIGIALMQASSYAASMSISTDEFLQQYYGQTADEFKESYRQFAEEGAKQMLAVFAIAKEEGLLTPVSEAESELSTYMQNLGYEDFDEFMSKVDGRGCYEYIHYDKIVQFLYDNADIS